MPADPAILRARLDTLRDVRAKGVRRARFGADEVEYRSDEELAAAIADLERQIAAAEGAVLPAVTFNSFRNNRGWS